MTTRPPVRPRRAAAQATPAAAPAPQKDAFAVLAEEAVPATPLMVADSGLVVPPHPATVAVKPGAPKPATKPASTAASVKPARRSLKNAVPAARTVASFPDQAAPKPPRLPQRDGKISGQPSFVLHSYPYKETSLIIDLFTRDYGRVALVAKGAKRPHSQLRGVLQTFQPLSAGWTGKSELRVLTGAEWVGGMLPLEKTALLCGFYLNELLVKLLARDDPHPALFDHYVATLNQLAHQEPAPIVLRKFERALLKETGVAADLSRCTVTRAPVQSDVQYVVDPDRGARPERAADGGPRVAGKTLLDMEREDYSDSATQVQSKQLMRFLLAHHLGGAVLNTRQILIDLMQL